MKKMEGEKEVSNLPHTLTPSHPHTLTPGEKRREFYIPPAPPEEEDKIFATMAAGINFNKYDDIPVEVTGSDAPPPIKR